jgi:hypothetical protein
MMDISINLNENKVVAIYNEDWSGDIKLKVTKELYNQIFEGMQPVKYVNGELMLDAEQAVKNEMQAEIEDITQELMTTDAVVTEAMEYQLRGEPIPDAHSLTLIIRENARTRINELKELMNTM